MASLRLLLCQVAQRSRRRTSQNLVTALPFATGAALCLCTMVTFEEPPTTNTAMSCPLTFRQCMRSIVTGLDQRPRLDALTTSKSRCEGLLEVETVFPRSFNESDRFFQVLEYHRTLLPDYTNRWAGADPPSDGHKTWPRKIPSKEDIPALEMDFRFCKRSPNYRDKDRACQDLQFRIGAYYVTAFKDDPEMQMKGYRMIKELAEQGHPDGMCYYGKGLLSQLQRKVDALLTLLGIQESY